MPPVNDSATADASSGVSKGDNGRIEAFVSPGDASHGRKRRSEALEEAAGSGDEPSAQTRKKMRTISPVPEDGDDADDVADQEKNEQKKGGVTPVLCSPVVVDDVPVSLRRVDSGEWVIRSSSSSSCVLC